MKSSYTSSTTSLMRASGRSTLLMHRMTGILAAKALRRTNRVCGSGPSEASTSSTTPSTMDRPRSTSPPKSAWPGVSMMLRVMPPCLTAVFLARMVMPFSRSRSLESMTRSSTSWLARNAPDCQSMASTSVVLPWSTCAMIAMFRRSSRLFKGMMESRSRSWRPAADTAASTILVDRCYHHVPGLRKEGQFRQISWICGWPVEPGMTRPGTRKRKITGPATDGQGMRTLD